LMQSLYLRRFGFVSFVGNKEESPYKQD